MIDAYVSPDAEPETITRPSRLYVWLLAILLLVFGVVLIVRLAQNRPQVIQENRLEVYQQRFKCGSGEVLIVEEFATGLYKVDCVARG